MTQTSHPPYTPAEARARETYLALMWALSYPGRSYTLPATGSPYESIRDTLLDLETTYYTPNTSLNDMLARSGARSLSPDAAAYHFYAKLGEADFTTIRAASIGTLLYPDRAATLIIGCTIGQGETLKLTGAGIQTENTIHVGGLPSEFWTIREQRRRYPLGWDIFLIDQFRVIGLPRSTQITR